ncbi:MAG: sigma-70 family RNA polymerase sigma factor [Verrucomicrobiales bacterium]|nr:sigma-70 family RNA polymerase sigma factor [Verrucomicrobiales bacterium]
MAQLRADSTAALDRIIGRHGPALHAYLVRLVQDPEDARDLALETFVRVHSYRDRYDAERPFNTWLYTIATNLARDRLRWRSRHRETALPDESDPIAQRTQLAARVTDRTPSRDLESAERAEAVRQAVARLPEDLRTVVLLSEFENQSNADIASVLGCSVKAVEMRLYRARAQLRNLLSAWILE